MRVLSLFAGIGGFDLGFERAGFSIAAQVEKDKYCLAILEHHFPQAKRYGDIREVTGEQITRDCGSIDIICGGFPCQDISSAGKGAGLEGERSGLWWEMHRLINELRPTWVVIENVAAIRNRGFDTVADGMESIGYAGWPLVVEAASIGAPHKRSRLVYVAHTNSNGLKGKRRRSLLNRKRQAQRDDVNRCSSQELMGDSASERLKGGFTTKEAWQPFRFVAAPGQDAGVDEQSRTVESALGFTVDGLPVGLALSACGNAFVPGIPYLVAKTIARVERQLDK